MKFITVQVNAILDNGTIQLLDRHGKRIGKRMEPSDVQGELSAGDVMALKWRAAVARLTSVSYAVGCRSQQGKGTWQYKTETLAKSFNHRLMSRCRAVARSRVFFGYGTATWLDAGRRMARQGTQAVRENEVPEWQRWANCVRGNHNKKAMAKRDGK